MGVIITPKYMTCQRQKCVHTHSQIMRYHTGNVYCDVVPNVKSSIFLTIKIDDKYTKTSPSICFRIYHLIARFKKHGRLPLTDNKSCRKCQQDTASGKPKNIYTRKELVMMETTISNFHTSFYILEIQKFALTFHMYKY